MSDTNLLVLAKEFAKLRKDVAKVLELPVGPQGEQGEQGIKGEPGNHGMDGKDGKNGLNGSDGMVGADGRDGKDGKQGIDGTDGADGVSVVNAEVDFDNHLRMTLSDGRVIDAGEIKVDSTGSVFVSGASSTGGGTTSTIGSAVLDFGAFPGSNEASIAVTGQTGITAESVVRAYIGADDTSGTHTAADHRYFAVFTQITTGSPTVDTGFTIYARSSEKMTGTFAVRWVWS